MNSKKLCFLFLIFMLIPLLSSAEKRKPALPLEELQNPKSPSYVPIPYPQTRKEIITDVKHIIKELYEPRKDRFSIHVNKRKRRGQELLELLKDDGRLKFGKILRVKNYYRYYSEDYTFLVDILDENDQLEARMHIRACGIWSQTAFFDEDEKKIFKPLRSKEEAKEIFYNLKYDVLGSLEIIDMERIIFGYSYISSPTSPVWVINTTTGTYYMDTNRYDVYRLVKKLSTIEMKSIKRESSRGTAIQNLIKKYPSYIIDNVNDVYYVLEKITKTNIFIKKEEGTK